MSLGWCGGWITDTVTDLATGRFDSWFFAPKVPFEPTFALNQTGSTALPMHFESIRKSRIGDSRRDD